MSGFHCAFKSETVAEDRSFLASSSTASCLALPLALRESAVINRGLVMSRHEPAVISKADSVVATFAHVLASLLKTSCRVGQARFERRPTICNRCVSWWAGAAKRRWFHPTPLFQQALANVATVLKACRGISVHTAIAAALLISNNVDADEPPTPRLNRVTFTDVKSITRTIESRVLLEAQDGGLLLEGRDGRLWNVTPKQLQKRETTDDPFQPLSAEQLGEQLAREVAEFGIKTPVQVVVTKHFVVCSTAGRAYAEWCGSLFERLHDAFHAFWKEAGLELRESEFPLPAIVLKDRTEFAEFATKHDRPDAAEAPGYFSEPTNRIILFDLTAGPNSTPAKTAGDIRRKLDASPFNVATMVHEATHQLAFNSGLHTRFADNPRWLTEGMAMFFEVPDLDSRTGWKTIGRVNAPRLRDLRETVRNPREFLPLADLIRSDESFLNADQSRAAYSESWALTYFLLKTRGNDVVSFLKSIQRKRLLIADSPDDRLREFQTTFGDLVTLERDWKKWIRRQGK